MSIFNLRKQRVVNGALQQLCVCGHCKIYFEVKPNSNKRFAIGHSRKGTNSSSDHVMKISLALLGKKGHEPWNKGLTKDTSSSLALAGSKSHERQLKNPRKWTEKERQNHELNKKPNWKIGLTKETDSRVHSGWNKGLTKETDERVAKAVEKGTQTLKDKSEFFRDLAYDMWSRPGHREIVHESMSGINHPFYKANPGYSRDDYPGYPLDWTDQIREVIRTRDGRACQLCGKTEQDNKKQMDVHHINYDKKDLNPENLISLCHSCHGKTTHKRAYWTQYLSEFMLSHYSATQPTIEREVAVETLNRMNSMQEKGREHSANGGQNEFSG